MFSLGGFDFHYYGLIMFVSIVVAIFVIRYMSKKYYKTVDTEIIIDVLPIILIASILGARFYYVLLDLPYFMKYPDEILAIWNGGMSIHGGIIGGVLAGAIISKIKKINFLKYADVFYNKRFLLEKEERINMLLGKTTTPELAEVVIVDSVVVE